MYEYNFNDIRKTIEEILDKSLTKSKEAYYNQLEIFKKDQNKRYWYRTITIFLCNHFFLKCRNSFLNSRLQLKKSKKRRTA